MRLKTKILEMAVLNRGKLLVMFLNEPRLHQSSFLRVRVMMVVAVDPGLLELQVIRDSPVDQGSQAPVVLMETGAETAGRHYLACQVVVETWVPMEPQGYLASLVEGVRTVYQDYPENEAYLETRVDLAEMVSLESLGALVSCSNE